MLTAYGTRQDGIIRILRDERPGDVAVTTVIGACHAIQTWLRGTESGVLILKHRWKMIQQGCMLPPARHGDVGLLAARAKLLIG